MVPIKQEGGAMNGLVPVQGGMHPQPHHQQQAHMGRGHHGVQVRPRAVPVLMRALLMLPHGARSHTDCDHNVACLWGGGWWRLLQNL